MNKMLKNIRDLNSDPQVCEVAQVHPPAEAEGGSPDQAEGSTSSQPVLQHLGQADRWRQLTAASNSGNDSL